MHLLSQFLNIFNVSIVLVLLNKIKLTPLLTMFCLILNLVRLSRRNSPSQTIPSGIRKYLKDMREIDHQNLLALRKFVGNL